MKPEPKAVSHSNPEHFRTLLHEHMVRRGLRATDQRRLIVDTFFAAPNHVSIEELLAQVREKDPRVGYATVYRTLKLLTECGVAYERKFGDGLTRYELADDESHHDHLICVSLPHDPRVRGAAHRGAPGGDRPAPRVRRADAQARDVRTLRGLPRQAEPPGEARRPPS